MEGLIVEKRIQHRVVEYSNYTLDTTIPTNKIQKNIKSYPPKRGAVAFEPIRKRSLSASIKWYGCRCNEVGLSCPRLHRNFMEHCQKYHMANLPGPLQSPVESNR